MLHLTELLYGHNDFAYTVSFLKLGLHCHLPAERLATAANFLIIIYS